jgi:D-tyrosyl-tRNA(Tyr) deacylase
MGQPTQYAAADGARLSILSILDMSRKTSPVGVPENYVFTLEPAHHGLINPETPSLVAVIVINGHNPTPSSWSRHKTAIQPPAG